MFRPRVVPLLLFVLIGAPLHAAELKVLAGSAVQPAMEVLAPNFERQSGYHVVFDYGTIGAMAERASSGEKADVVIVSRPQMDALAKARRIVPDTRRTLGKTGIGVFVRKGAALPDIETVESFKRTMLEAKSIGFNDPAAGAPVGIYLLELFKRLDIDEAMRAKTVVFTQRSERFDAVARGDVQIGFNQESEIVGQPQVQFVGPLPRAIQKETVFAIAALSSGTHEDAARAFTAFLSLPESIVVLRRKGLDAP
jgi:molybdate transport system substrate-binding protein